MTVPGNIDALLLGGQRGYQIERSLRFNSADSAYLGRTPGSNSTSQTIFTVSVWVKRCALSASSRQSIFYTGLSNGSGNLFSLEWNNDSLACLFDGPGTYWPQTTAKFRDPSAWYHIVAAVDTTQTTAANRCRFYVNGVEQTSLTGTQPPQNHAVTNGTTSVHNIGAISSTYSNQYITEFYYINNQQLTPSSFGETDTVTGVWKPKAYTGTYTGTNSCYLNFKDNSGATATTLGKDYSGNGNNYTPNNFSVTAGAGNDSLIDTPTPYADGGNGRGNYCTWNPLSLGTDGTLSDGNLQIAYGGATTRNATMATMGMTSGKWYWEITPTASSLAATACTIGITNVSSSSAVSNYPGFSANGWGYEGNTGSIYNNGSGTSYGATFAVNDVIGVAFDATNGKIWFSKNGTFQASGDPAAGTNAAFSSLAANTYYPAIGDGSAANTFTAVANFGQRAFAYTPPSGFLALNTQNLPEPSIKKPSSYFDTLLYTGNSATSSAGTTARTLTGLGFQPDLIWVKSRNNGGTWSDHSLTDTVRGANLSLSSNTTGTETNVATGFSQGGVGTSTSDGFTIVSGTAGGTTNLNSSSGTYVAWCWDESATPGFDIVTYTGNGGTTQTIGHSLGVVPNFIVIKNRDSADGWAIYHSSIGATGYLDFTTGSTTTSASTWNNTSPTSSVFTVNTNTRVNGSSTKHVAYLWSEVAGFSKFGSYTGNGSTDGPFVFCGFRPRWIVTKGSSAITDWVIHDTKRETYNQAASSLYPNTSGTETSLEPFDILSNGFKIRTGTAGNVNNNGTTYIFAAFAESPFKFSLAR